MNRYELVDLLERIVGQFDTSATPYTFENDDGETITVGTTLEDLLNEAQDAIYEVNTEDENL